MTVTVAIDPGSRITGIAILHGSRAWSMLMKAQTTEEISGFLESCVVEFGSFVLVLEDQHLVEHGAKEGNRGKVNWPSIVTLVAARVRWQTIAELRGIKVRLANASAWQAKMHAGVPKLGPGGKKLNRKQRSKLAVQAIWRDVPRITGPSEVGAGTAQSRPSGKATNDEADALCIGRWASLYGEP